MVPLPTISGVHRVAFNWRHGAGGPTATNVMHFRGASTDTLALKNALDANVTTAMWFGMDSSAVVYQLQITPLDGSSATIVYPVTGTKWGGTGAPSEFSPATATVVSFKTATRGRRARGRIYLPFQLETMMSSGIAASSVAACQTAWDTWRAAMSTALYPLVIATYGHSLHKHKNTDGSVLYSPVSWTADSYPVTSITVESTFGTQRRRQSRLRV